VNRWRRLGRQQDRQEWKLLSLERTQSGLHLIITVSGTRRTEHPRLALVERRSDRTVMLPLQKVDAESPTFSADIQLQPGEFETFFSVDTWDAYVFSDADVAGGTPVRYRLRSNFKESESLYTFHRPLRLAAIPYTTVQGNFSIRIRKVTGSAKLVRAQWDGDGVLSVRGYVFGPLVDPAHPEGVRLSVLVRNEWADMERRFPADPVEWVEDTEPASTDAPSGSTSLAFTARIHLAELDLAQLMDHRLEFFLAISDRTESTEERLLPVRQTEVMAFHLDDRTSVVHTRAGAVRIGLGLDGKRPLLYVIPHDLEVEVTAIYARDEAIEIQGQVIRPQVVAPSQGTLVLCRRFSQTRIEFPVEVVGSSFSATLGLQELLRAGLRPGLWELSLALANRSCRLKAWQDGIPNKNQCVRFPRQRVMDAEGVAFAVYPLYIRGNYLAVMARQDARVKSVSRVVLLDGGMSISGKLEFVPPIESPQTVSGTLIVKGEYGAHYELPVRCTLQQAGKSANDFSFTMQTTLTADAFQRIRDGVVHNLHFDSIQCELTFASYRSRFPLNLSPEKVEASLDDRLNRRPRLKRYMDHGRVLAYRALNRLLPMRRQLVVFQSFYGNSYACNPRAIYEEMLRQGRNFQAVWVMKDVHKRLPGSPKLVKPRSSAYFYYMAVAKYFINNGNFPDFYRKRPGAVHVQTWHGTPLKRLGYDVDPSSTAYAENTAPELMNRVRRWDYLVAPNHYTAEILCRAYRYDKQVLEVGYPRNDVFYRPDAAERAREIKRKLAIDEDKQVILYAPTWRDSEHQGKRKNSPFEFRFDFEDFRQRFGHQYVLLLRLHYFDAARMQFLDEGGVVRNVTYYDDIADLYLISDILITDYSSVMFDFANSGRPMIFFTYDLLKYRSVMRGFYFDFEREAPGPLVTNQADLFTAIAEVDRISERYADKYQAFRERFCSLEDGHAAERVIQAVFDGAGKGERA
jgi:CDP-glycerol glycerophosphotransferase